LVGKQKEETLGKPRHRLENIRIDPTEIKLDSSGSG
jgi:hypothetical protein